jgi:hypothetical protein
MSIPCEKELNNLMFVDTNAGEADFVVNKHEVIGKYIDTRSGT